MTDPALTAMDHRMVQARALRRAMYATLASRPEVAARIEAACRAHGEQHRAAITAHEAAHAAVTLAARD